MTKEEIAQKLHKIKTFDIKKILSVHLSKKETDLVIITGTCYEKIVFHGAINKEVNCYASDTFFIDAKQGLIEPHCGDYKCPLFLKTISLAIPIKAFLFKEPYEGGKMIGWQFKTELSHTKFDIYLPGVSEVILCRSIVFTLTDLRLCQRRKRINTKDNRYRNA